MSEWPILLYIALIGAWVLYEDLRYGKIRNRVLVFSLAVGLVWNGWLFVDARFLGNDFIPADKAFAYLGAVGLDVAISFALAFLLWIFRFWAAGDAKLFTVLTLLLPLRVYRQNMLDYFPSFVLFFNTFIVFFGLILAEFVGKVVVRFFARRLYREHGALWRAFKAKVLDRPGTTLKLLVGLIALFLIVKFIRHFLRDWIWAGFHLNQTMLYLVLFILLEPLRDLFRKPWVFALSLAVLLGTMAWWGWQGNMKEIEDVLSISAFMVGLIVFKEIYDTYTDRFDVREVSPVEIHPGAVLSDKQVKRLTSNSEFNNEQFGVMEADGLSPRQVEVLTTWCVKTDPTMKLEIYNTIPFTPGIVLGTLATVVFAGYILVI